MNQSFVAYNRFNLPVRSFGSHDLAQRFVDSMAALGSTFTIKPTRLPRHASN